MKRKIKYLMLLTLIIAGVYGWYQYREFVAVPTTRLAAGSYYPEMPPDKQHHYLQLPIDHSDPARGSFTDFYILSPNFKAGDEVIFWLFDNQQERVGMLRKADDFEVFEANLKGLSYVLIGNRGVSPTLFPEVFNSDGSVNYALAMKLYGSDQQIEDIEAVRKDIQSRGLLPPDGKIMVYGGSGGGVLVQQFLDKYGDHVSRALIESTGAPDLARQYNTTFFASIHKSNPDVANAYFELLQKGEASPSLAFMLFKLGLAGPADLQDNVMNSQTSSWTLTDKLIYIKKWLNPQYNFPLINFIMNLPLELEVKVRIYELVGADLNTYHPASAGEVCVGYDWIKILLADFIKAREAGIIPLPQINVDRSSYAGEIMVWSGSRDQDFTIQMGRWIVEAYPHSRLAVFDDNHVRVRYSEYYREFRKAFFSTGLSSPETEGYFKDTRQLNQ